jgi:hypothetical protein
MSRPTVKLPRRFLFPSFQSGYARRLTLMQLDRVCLKDVHCASVNNGYLLKRKSRLKAGS